MTKTGVIATASTKDALERLINKYFYSSGYTVTDDKKIYDSELSSDKLAKLNTAYSIVVKSGRWQFKLN